MTKRPCKWIRFLFRLLNNEQVSYQMSLSVEKTAIHIIKGETSMSTTSTPTIVASIKKISIASDDSKKSIQVTIRGVGKYLFQDSSGEYWNILEADNGNSKFVSQSEKYSIKDSSITEYLLAAAMIQRKSLKLTIEGDSITDIALPDNNV
ncbi:hypothetical protein [uncultured Fibrobacter sp.]|uniref:hypothetical protein n=1 Tax=uncultured Fibrobacter sp. TaxID=261512 RepID=UPI002803F343|nr:hypothetical protein [uncultured Fibrobacter sp.]